MVINNVLAVTEATEDLGGVFSSARWGYAGQMTALGMLMVFLVLASLWGVLVIFKLVFAKESHKAKDKAPKAIADAVAEAVKVEDEYGANENGETYAADTEDGELVAVITAAVAAYIASEEPEDAYKGGFRVVSFRKASGARAWNSK